jgi:SanA protein
VRRLLFRLFLFSGFCVVAVAAINFWMIWRARPRIMASLKELPATDIGIVLGTSPRLAGRPNLFFEGRMDAAAELYRAHRVRHLLVSGDNGTRGYDEPTAMKSALLARGVPASAMTLDYAGFRTLDTMARARAVFGVKKAILITDPFHQARSLFLADAFGINAIGYPARPLPIGTSLKTHLRELASRTVAFFDIYVLHTKPRFYGPPVKLPL